jgi:hypothetical protein
MNINPLWRHAIQARLLPELAELGADVEINEDGLMRATWPAGVEEIQSDVIVKLQVLPVAQNGAGWAGSGEITVDEKARRFVMVKQLRHAHG